MTQDNQHGQAREFIASHFAYLAQFAKMFYLIDELHKIDGHLDNGLRAYRNRVTDDMFFLMKYRESVETISLIKECL